MNTLLRWGLSRLDRSRLQRRHFPGASPEIRENETESHRD